MAAHAVPWPQAEHRGLCDKVFQVPKLDPAFCLFCWVLGTTGCKKGKMYPEVVSAKGKMPHDIIDFSSWALPAGIGRAGRSLWFSQIKARSNGELCYGKGK